MTEETKQTNFEHWCLVELMGHQRVAGRVTEENLFGTVLMRVDIPATKNGRPGYTKYYGPSAIYAITPIEQEAAEALANIYDVRPVEEWRLRSLLPENTNRLEMDGDDLADSDDEDDFEYAEDEAFEYEEAGTEDED